MNMSCKSETIVIVDDEQEIADLLEVYLKNESYVVRKFYNPLDALACIEKEPVSLVILDVMMPGVDGFMVCKEVRETSQIPIVMLTAKSEENDILNGYEYGADEYIPKPFSPKILVAHVNAIIRRTSDADDGNKDLLEAGGIVIDRKAHIVTIDGQEIILSVKEFELLTYFMQNAGIALSRDRILNGVWNYDYFGDARTIDTHVKKLRAKLGDKGNYIKTIWGMGYKFEVEE